MQDTEEIQEARRWLLENCHHGHSRYVLERGLAYLEAVVRAGFTPETVDAEDLYTWLTSPECEQARRRCFIQPGL